MEMAQQGYAVVVHGSTDSSHLASAYEEVKQLSPASIRIAADLSVSSAIREMFETIRSTYGGMDALVNNAAIQKPGPITEMEESNWDSILSVNLKAPFLCSQQAVPLMQSRGGGKIVNISSVHATDPRRNYAHYSCAKAGLGMLTKCMAMELAAYNIQANTIVVGGIATELTPPERQAILLSSVPANRIGTIEEIARLAAFLCSHACDYMTGADVVVDGGLTLGFCASRPDL
jgi:NAD(P)-dependent dehydrogenase (short-subunit alcohol dehydrogenase family)